MNRALFLIALGFVVFLLLSRGPTGGIASVLASIGWMVGGIAAVFGAERLDRRTDGRPRRGFTGGGRQPAAENAGEDGPKSPLRPRRPGRR